MSQTSFESEHPWGKYPALNKDWWPVRLLPDDIGWIERIAAKRFEHARASGYIGNAKQASVDLDISGLAGEFAVSLMVNAPINNAFTTDLGRTREGDILDFIEVKTARGDNPRLWNLVCNKVNLRPDRLYMNALTTWYPHWVVITGWAQGSDFLTKGRTAIAAAGHPIYILDFKYLNPPKDIFDIIRVRHPHM